MQIVVKHREDSGLVLPGWQTHAGVTSERRRYFRVLRRMNWPDIHRFNEWKKRFEERGKERGVVENDFTGHWSKGSEEGTRRDKGHFAYYAFACHANN